MSACLPSAVATKERKKIVSILMRQTGDAKWTMADRVKVFETVKIQERDITMAL